MLKQNTAKCDFKRVLGSILRIHSKVFFYFQEEINNIIIYFNLLLFYTRFNYEF